MPKTKIRSKKAPVRSSLKIHSAEKKEAASLTSHLHQNFGFDGGTVANRHAARDRAVTQPDFALPGLRG